MKKACVVGGSNGIGLAISLELIKQGYYVFIFDVVEPDKSILTNDATYEYVNYNLLDFYVEPFKSLIEDQNLEVLMLTAGIGRCAHFENLCLGEIEKILTINSESIIKIVRLFYSRIKNVQKFYCGIMGSIAGLINSPLFSVYAASKAAICRFIESINIELEYGKYSNRILNVSPGSIKGTKFNGSNFNDIDSTIELARNILSELFNSSELYIPEYETIYKKVIEKNISNSHLFGLESYEYKLNSGRRTDEYKGCIGYLSGTFDLFHVGHLNLLKRAKKNCDYLVVGIHPDASHKGKETFIPFNERKEIVRSVRFVDEVITSFPEDSDVWDIVHYNKLFVGSDYKNTERFKKYEKYFEDKNVEIVYFPYTQGTSSTQIRDVILKTKKMLF